MYYGIESRYSSQSFRCQRFARGHLQSDVSLATLTISSQSSLSDILYKMSLEYKHENYYMIFNYLSNIILKYKINNIAGLIYPWFDHSLSDYGSIILY